MSDQDQVDAIVRFHDVRRLGELNRCVFSLLGQTHRPLNIVLALQRFTEAQIAQTFQSLRPMLGLPGSPALTVVNYQRPDPSDARAALLNLGLRSAEGRYVAFLDYDDVLYPEAYGMLVSRLRATNAAIAFAAVRAVKVDVYPQFTRVASEIKDAFGTGRNAADLLRGNFCPIHSYMIDRARVDTVDLLLDEKLTWEEDYDLLLRLCAKYRSDFELIHIRVGDYYYKTDGSNSTAAHGARSTEQLRQYEVVSSIIEARRRTTHVSPCVQDEYGIVPTRPSLTIRGFLDARAAAQDC